MALEMKYFVLKPRSKQANDPYALASRCAMKAYAESICGVDDELADGLDEWVRDEERYEDRLPGVRD